MDKVIIILEGIAADLGFSGLESQNTDIIKRIKDAAKLCRELGLETGAKLLEESETTGGDIESFTRLCCFIECLSEARF